MLTVLTLVGVITGTTLGVKTCNATQTVSCYGIHGRPLHLQLMTSTRGYDLRLERKNNIDYEGILRFSKNRTVFYQNTNASSINQRFHYFSGSGTLIINPVEMNDSGTYRVQIFNTSGVMVVNKTVQLIITNETLTSFTKSPFNRTEHTVDQQTVYILMSGSLGVFCLCLTVSGGIFYIYKSRKSSNRADTEVVYADVSILKGQKRLQEQRERGEEMVEYGEVKVQNAHTPVLQGDCFPLPVYSEAI